MVEDVKATQERREFHSQADPVLFEELDIVIRGEIPSLGGWFLLAKIDSAGIVFGVPGAPDAPAEYRERIGECDHCEKIRKRSETFVVMHQTGETKLVGRTCLGDFLGAFALDPHRVWKLLVEWSEVGSDDKEYEWGGSKWVPTHTPIELIQTTFKAIRTHGWAPKSASGIPTAALVGKALDDQRMMRHDGEGKSDAEILRDEFKTIEVDEELCEAAFRWALSDDDNDYRKNIQQLAGMAEVSSKYYGFVCSILPSYERELGRQIEYAKQEKKQAEEVQRATEWIGEIGERITVEAIVTGKRFIQSDWGVTTLVKFETTEGYKVAWFASGNGANYGDPGDKVAVTGRVKSHNEFKGAKETIVTRAKMEKK
jgi:hypothetical protein